MLIDFDSILKLIDKPKRILHCGSHKGEDQDVYDKHGIKAFHVECNPDLFPIVQARVGRENCSNLAVSSRAGETLPFHKIYSHDRSNMGCSSVLEPGIILNNPYLERFETIEVQTTTVDVLNERYGPFDFLNCDVQGFELEVLKGGHNLLSGNTLKTILLEYTTISMYKDDCLLDDLDRFLQNYGFERILTELAASHLCWGDFLSVRKEK